MRAMVLTVPGSIHAKPLRLAAFPDPVPGPGEVVIRVGACAACRTDLQVCEGDLPARILPIIPGHQVAGRIEAVGPDCGDWREGDRAGLTWLAGTCGECAFCLSGRENLCERATFTGWDRHGGFAELVCARADVVVPLPEGPADRDLAPLLCGGVIGFRALRVAGITPGARVAQGQTLLLIEAMKTFNQIRAPKAGIITRILIETGSPVEYGEPLLVIE